MQNTIARTKVKICGMTQASQVAELVNLSVDAVGVMLYADSPRKITIEQAQEIRKQIPAFISMVGVFVDCDVEQVNDYSNQIGLDLIQLHGAESSEYAANLNTPYIKAVRAKKSDQVIGEIAKHQAARAILLDPYVEGQHGGTGQQLAPDVWPKDHQGLQKIILAGGLAADNLLSGMQRYHPYAVDLNSGVEVSPGVKDIDEIEKCLSLIDR